MDERIDQTFPSTTRRAFAIGTVLAGAAAVLPRGALRVAAKQEADLANVGLPTLDITVTADSYEGVPAATAAGRYLLTVTVDQGLEQGGVAFLQPPPGMTAADFLEAIGIGQEVGAAASPSAAEEAEEGEEEEGPLPTFVYLAKFAGVVAGGGLSSSAVVELTEGEWIAWGDDPSAPQMPVIFTVTGDIPGDVAEPAADITVTLLDFDIMVEGNLTAGDHIVKVVNAGAQPHFFELEKVPDGTTNDDLAALIEAFMTGTPAATALDPETDFTFVTYTPTQSIGTQTWHTVSLEAGAYAGLCFFPTAGTGVPHAAEGMHTVFEVTA